MLCARYVFIQYPLEHEYKIGTVLFLVVIQKNGE